MTAPPALHGVPASTATLAATTPRRGRGKRRARPPSAGIWAVATCLFACVSSAVAADMPRGQWAYYNFETWSSGSIDYNDASYQDLDTTTTSSEGIVLQHSGTGVSANQADALLLPSMHAGFGRACFLPQAHYLQVFGDEEHAAEFSACAWFNTSAAAAAAAVTGQPRFVYASTEPHDPSSDASVEGWSVVIAGDGSLQLNVSTAAAASGASVSPATASTPVFGHGPATHICITRSRGAVWTVFVNGTTAASLNASASDSASVSASAPTLSFVAGLRPRGHGDESLLGTVDNLRLMRVALTPAEVATLFETDTHQDRAAPVPMPDGFTGHIRREGTTNNQGHWGSESSRRVVEGAVAMDTVNSRFSVQGTASDEFGDSYNIFIAHVGDMYVESRWRGDNMAGANCTMRPLDCDAWPISFACTTDCPRCPDAEAWHTFSQWTGPPVRCGDGEVAGVDHRRCVVRYSLGGTEAEFLPDSGAPVQGWNAVGWQGHQSGGSTTTSVQYTDVAVQAPELAAFSHPSVGVCLSDADNCRSYCSGNGVCSTQLPGVCICDAGWQGLRCDTPDDVQPCAITFTPWSECDRTCGVGNQTRTGVFAAPQGSTASCSGDEVVETRLCNTQPCDDGQCTNCWGDTAGPCRNPANGVCYDYYTGTTMCPAGTKQCGDNCPSCSGSPHTVGPCIHDNDGTCLPFIEGTTLCYPGSSPCEEPPAPNATATADGMCTGCWPLTTGPCKQANSVCWPFLPGTSQCPVGTHLCAADDAPAMPPLESAVIELELDGVDVGTMNSTVVDGVAAAVADACGTDESGVVVEVITAGAGSSNSSAAHPTTSDGNGTTGGGHTHSRRLSAHSYTPSVVLGLQVPSGGLDGNGVQAAEAVYRIEGALDSGELLQRLTTTPGLTQVTAVRTATPPRVINPVAVVDDASGDQPGDDTDGDARDTSSDDTTAPPADGDEGADGGLGHAGDTSPEERGEKVDNGEALTAMLAMLSAGTVAAVVVALLATHYNKSRKSALVSPRFDDLHEGDAASLDSASPRGSTSDSSTTRSASGAAGSGQYAGLVRAKMRRPTTAAAYNCGRRGAVVTAVGSATRDLFDSSDLSTGSNHVDAAYAYACAGTADTTPYARGSASATGQLQSSSGSIGTWVTTPDPERSEVDSGMA